MEGEFVAPSVSPPYNQKNGVFSTKITWLRCLNLSEGGCRAQLNSSALTEWGETLVKRGVALSEGVFIAGLGIPSPHAPRSRSARGGGGRHKSCQPTTSALVEQDKRPCRGGCNNPALVEGGGGERVGDTPLPVQGYPPRRCGATIDGLADTVQGLPRADSARIELMAAAPPTRHATPRAPLAGVIALPSTLSPRYVAPRPLFKPNACSILDCCENIT